jgi:hypothetical protein
MPVIEGTVGIKTATGEYDFAVDGGAGGTITMRGSGALGGVIPAGSVIMGGYIEIDTLFTTGTAATMALQAESAGDLQAATVVSGAPYSTTGRKAIVPVWTAATFIKTTVARNLTAVIATGTITAGKGRVVVFYR